MMVRNKFNVRTGPVGTDHVSRRDGEGTAINGSFPGHRSLHFVYLLYFTAYAVYTIGRHCEMRIGSQ